MRPSIILALLIGTLSDAPAAQSQTHPIRVAVSVMDSSNQLTSAIASALRHLGDIQVVSEQELPEFVIAGVAICIPKCSELTSYSVALRLYSPFSRTTAATMANRATRGLGRLPLRDSLELYFWYRLRGYQRTHQSWVATWGRSRYEQATREFVREIDVHCFDRIRAVNRALASDDTAAVVRLDAFELSRAWIC